MKCGYLYCNYLCLLLQSKWKQLERSLLRRDRQLVNNSRGQHHLRDLHRITEAKGEETYHLLVTSPLLVAGVLMLLATVLHVHQSCQTLSGVCVGQSARIAVATVLLATAFMSLYRSRGRGK